MKERLRRLERLLKAEEGCRACRGPMLVLPREDFDRLEASEEGPLCPECGKPIKAKVYRRDLWELV
jgi:hypothetical protein